MSCWLFYVDESYDSSRFCLSALALLHSNWRQCFAAVRNHRVHLKQAHGILLSKEIHARDLVSGRGRLGPQIVTKYQRSRILLDILRLAGSMPKAFLLNVCLDVRGLPDPQLTAWDRLLNRIERTMVEFETREHLTRNRLSQVVQAMLPISEADEIARRLQAYSPRAIIISDEGRELEITRALRKMHVFNPIPSQFGIWRDGRRTANITIEHVIEDPVFKESHRSYFLQLVDCIAFALLKREVPPTPNVQRYGIHRMFDHAVSGICYRQASKKDPLGIVRQ